MAQIVPKIKARGVDFCGSNGTYYIVRSDLGFYMTSTNFHESGDLEVTSLHDFCRGGHHYVAHNDGLFYIIKGNAYCQVSNLKEDTCPVMYNLHPNCQEGDHYLSTAGYFYIIFQSRGYYRKVKNLSTNEDSHQYNLHPSCKNGMYYWGDEKYFYFVESQIESHVKYHRCNNLRDKPESDTYTFRDDVVKFLPGGPAVTLGSAIGKWELLMSYPNDENHPKEWTDDISRKVGCNKVATSLLEGNWKMSPSDASLLNEATFKYQLSLPATCGGGDVSSDQEAWSEDTEVVQSINLSLQPRKTINVWQYNLYLGNTIVLFTHYIDFTSDPINQPIQPIYVPLPPYNK